MELSEIYWDLSPEMIQNAEESIDWFKKNDKKLMDYLFEQQFPTPAGGDARTGRVDTLLYHFWTLSVKNKLPESIQTQIISLFEHRRISHFSE